MVDFFIFLYNSIPHSLSLFISKFVPFKGFILRSKTSTALTADELAYAYAGAINGVAFHAYFYSPLWLI